VLSRDVVSPPSDPRYRQPMSLDTEARLKFVSADPTCIAWGTCTIASSRKSRTYDAARHRYLDCVVVFARLKAVRSSVA
jgi:hypothetical protein